jgi:hypothetical protein
VLLKMNWKFQRLRILARMALKSSDNLPIGNPKRSVRAGKVGISGKNLHSLLLWFGDWTNVPAAGKRQPDRAQATFQA